MSHVQPVQLQQQLQNKHTDTPLLVDLRIHADFAISQIPGAVHMPLEKMTDQDWKKIAEHSEVILYCNTGIDSSKAYNQAQEKGLTHVKNLVGGLMGRSNEGLPIDQKKSTMPLMRQSLLAAGILVLIGLAGRLWIDQYFLLLTAFVGVGLTFAGASGFCGMSKLLALMPWNR